MQTIASVGVKSFARVLGAIYGAISLVVIPVTLIAGLASVVSGDKSALWAIGMIALSVCAPLFYAGMGFLLGAFMAWLYNVTAKWTGGFQIEVQPATPAASTNRVGLI